MITTFGLSGCNISSSLFDKYESNCLSSFGLGKYEDISFIKNKEFKEISNLLKTEYGAKSIRQILYVKSKNMYYCEFHENSYTINCVLLGKDMNMVSQEKLEFDW
ncbi:MAG: hypothetical protein LBE36_01325 [Flavobacteriaceae bacterium]|nr:hypothetical protein [Flavobacteriaceae bacterium]